MRRRLGVWRRADLEAAGIGEARRTQQVDSGRLTAHGNGWYTTRDTPEAVSGPLSRGHRATCVTAAQVHGLWTPIARHVHEAGRRGDPADLSGVVCGHRPIVRTWPDQEPVLPLPVALVHAAHCLSGEETAILLESALDRRLLSRLEIDDVLGQVPPTRRRRIGRISALAGSGSETRVRRFLERRGVRVREQVSIPGVGRVDLVVGDRLIIECDSRRFHDSESAYHVDRRRDGESLLGGYLVLRLTWEMIWLDWPSTSGRITALVGRACIGGSCCERAAERNGTQK